MSGRVAPNLHVACYTGNDEDASYDNQAEVCRNLWHRLKALVCINQNELYADEHQDRSQTQ